MSNTMCVFRTVAVWIIYGTVFIIVLSTKYYMLSLATQPWLRCSMLIINAQHNFSCKIVWRDDVGLIVWTEQVVLFCCFTSRWSSKGNSC